jgi:hypothetical protein
MASDKSLKSLSEEFEVVAVYDLPDSGGQERVADVITALQMLKEGDRARFFMKDMVEALDPAYDAAAAREPLQLLTGAHASGLRMSIVQAKREGIAAYLPLIEDTQTGKLLVVGPQDVDGADAWRELTYVNAGLNNRDKAITQVNDFVVAAARFRGEKDELDPVTARVLSENIIRAFFIMVEPKGVFASSPMADGTTLGECFAVVTGGEVDVRGYVVARSTFDADKSHAQVMQGVSGDIKVGKPFSFKPKT